MQTFNIKNLNDYRKVFPNLTSNVVLLNGGMGAGKTTFVKEFLKYKFNLMEDELSKIGVMSPTFSIENHYSLKNKKILHSDLYRVSEDTFDREEFLEGLEDFDWVFVEWPENLNLKNYLHDYCVVEITAKKNSDPSERTVSLS